MFVLDSHCDTPSQISRKRDLSLDNSYSHVDFPKLKRGGVDGVFFALYVPSSFDEDPESGFEYAMNLLEGVKMSVAANPDAAAFATSRSEAYVNKSEGRVAIFLGLENGAPIGNSLRRLKYFYDNDIRYVTLCHSGNNQICDSCATSVKKWSGLSPFGKDLVKEMNNLGMLVDVSHVSDDSFYDIMECSSKPVVATHSCCRSLCDHPRNMTDNMIRTLASQGGVIQINFYPIFLDPTFRQVLSESGIMEKGELIESEFIAEPENPLRRAAWNRVQDELMALPRPSFRWIADHIDHVVDIAGIDHVGLGSDFDGIEVTPAGLEDISMMPVVLDELRSRGYTEADLAKIAGGNFFRILG